MAVATPESYLADLNEAQREAVLATEGPLLVVAGAGSGKTRVLTYRVAHLIRACGVKPNEILAITFTNKAAGEMRERLERMLGQTARAIWILTFHAACGRMLRREAERLGYRSTFTIYDDQDQVRLVKACLEELGKDPKRFSPRGIHAQISRAKNELVSPEDYAGRVASFWDQTVAETYDLYQRRLHASNAVDFDDLLMLTVQVFERCPEALERWRKTFRYILVDEYQDTNHAQYRLLQLLGGEHGNVCAVGDPDQCLVAGTQVTMSDGTRVPIESVRVGDQVLSCWGSGEFGPSTVVGVHRSSRRAGVSIVLTSGRTLVSTPEHTHFAGFKPGWAPQLHMTYLMWKRGHGFRVGTSRTYTEGQNQPLPGPAFRMHQEHADAVWVLTTHESEAEARRAEVLASLRHGLPTLPFLARPTRPHDESRSVVGNQALLDEIFSELDTESAGRDLLEREGLSFDHPHFSAATTTFGGRVRRRLTVSLCADARRGKPQHRISLFGYDEGGRRALEAAGVALRPAYAGSPGWRYESSFADFGRLIEKVEDIEETLDVSVRFTARLASQPTTTRKDRNSLPFMPASAVRPGMVMVNECGEFDLVESVSRVELTAPVYDLNIDRTHNFIANGIVTHNSIYAFRGADIRNIMEFERDFPGTQIIALEQNYRSTNMILRAANSLIEQNRERKPKRLFSELGEGDPVRVIEVEDEHAEARFVAAEIAGLMGGDLSASEIAVFYRTNAQSRVLEDVLVRQDVPYQVIGGPRFYERAEIRDATAYLSVLVNPQDATSLLRIANRPRRGIGDTSIQRLVTRAENTGRTLFQAMADPEAAGVAPASCRAIRSFHSTMESLMALSQELPVDELLERVLEKSGTLDALEAERTIEARGRIENLQELVGVAREYRQQTADASLAGFLQDIALVSDQDTIRDDRGLVTLMTLHNAKGLEFRAVFVIGMEEGIFPHARSVEEQGVEEERRLCYVGMTRAMERLALTHTLSRSIFGRRSYNLASRFLDELPSEVERERLRPSSWSAYGSPPGAALEPRPGIALSTGDSVRHGSLGEGIVTGIEPGGVVTIRFAGDGTERRLMVEYAPLEKIA
ncbi:MAG TPA: UvrD-helicase domain-containing protein [Gaiellaceae bacterium]|nr:UvrD-helicase domain-containing protein [Gaiellaceae bacterium]